MAILGRLKMSLASTFSFFVDSWTELKKVKWPNRKELTSYTIVVVCTVIFVTLYFVVIDFIISEALLMFFK